MTYQRNSRKKRLRAKARRLGKFLPHPRVGVQSRTIRRAGTKTNRVPGWHPAAGAGGAPDYKYPGFYPGRLRQEDTRR